MSATCAVDHEQLIDGLAVRQAKFLIVVKRIRSVIFNRLTFWRIDSNFLALSSLGFIQQSGLTSILSQ